MRTARTMVPLRPGVRPASVTALHDVAEAFGRLTPEPPTTPARFVGYAAPHELPERWRGIPRVALYEAD